MNSKCLLKRAHSLTIASDTWFTKENCKEETISLFRHCASQMPYLWSGRLGLPVEIGTKEIRFVACWKEQAIKYKI